MKFGVRECANITFKPTSDRIIANKLFKAGRPCLFIDTAKMSTLEGASTTVYATGGRGNVRLISWEGEKTLTFTVEDALLSPISFSMLSGAGLFGQAPGEITKVHIHTTTATTISGSDGNFQIDLTNALAASEEIAADAPIAIGLTDEGGEITGEFIEPAADNKFTVATKVISGFAAADNVKAGASVFVDYYVLKPVAQVTEMQIDAEHFAGYYYVEADTLVRRQYDGVDLATNFTLPNVKIQSNFTFAMAGTGDPSTFTFTMDAFPGYTYFDKTKKVLCVMQVVDPDSIEDMKIGTSVMYE